MTDKLDRSLIVLAQEPLWLFQVQPNKIMCTYGLAHIIFLFLLPLSLTTSFLFSINLNSSSEWVLRKNHEIFHCDRKMNNTEAKTLILFTKGKHAFKCVTYKKDPH